MQATGGMGGSRDGEPAYILEDNWHRESTAIKATLQQQPPQETARYLRRRVLRYFRRRVLCYFRRRVLRYFRRRFLRYFRRRVLCYFRRRVLRYFRR